MAKTGRPYKNIDKEQFEKLCALQCNITEFQNFFDCSDETINNWCKRTYGKSFSETFAIKRGKGKISLRRMQMQLAEKSAAMAIFLGKNYLEQSDKIRVEQVDNGLLYEILNFLNQGDDNANS